MDRVSRPLVAIAMLLALEWPIPGAQAENLEQAWGFALRVNQGLQSQQFASLATGADLSAAERARLPTVSTQNYNFLLSNSPALSLGGSGISPSTGLPQYLGLFGRNQNDLPISLTLASVPLYTGGKLLRDIDAAGHRVNAQRNEEFRTALVPAKDVDWKTLAERAMQSHSEFARMSESDLASITQQALQRRPELAGLTSQTRALGAQAESTLSAIRPQVGISGGFALLGAQDLAPQGYGVVMLSANWTLTDSGATRRRSEAIRQRERAALAQRADLAAEIALQVRTRWLDLYTSRLRVPVARVAVEQAEENNKVITQRYRNEVSTYTEVLDAENRRIQSLNNYYNAIYDESLALFRLRRAIGDL